MATDYSKRVRIPSKDSINGGMSSTGSSLADIFGRPGSLTYNCSPVTNERLLALMGTKDVGPFKVTGFLPAVASLEWAFERVQKDDADLFRQIKTAGMTCCRLIRGSTRSYSIHSWGAAIDLYCGRDVEPLGSPYTQLGVLELYRYLHAAGWYWGAEFRRNDAMHFEVSRQAIYKWKAQNWESVSKKLARFDDIDKLVLNGVLVEHAKLQDNSWWLPRNDLYGVLKIPAEAPDTRMVKLRAGLDELGYAIPEKGGIGDHRAEKDRFYVYAYPSRGA